ncbi:MAG: autotransporter domain-containing protein [Methyloceanibacter sp.]|nr:autotransporter domain-containing protein [Methyloceanibacter sp.]
MVDYYWEGDDPNDGTNWFVGENWDTGIVPGVGAGVLEDVIIDDPNVLNQPVIDGNDPLYADVDLGSNFVDINAGHLTIRNAGKLSNVSGFIASNSGDNGSVTVTGSGSTWKSTTNVVVGLLGSGTLNVEAGGRVYSSRGYIGHRLGSNGKATITGEGSVWTITENSGWSVAPELDVGREGTGILNIAERGMVNVHSELGQDGMGTVTVASLPGSTGTVNIGAALGETPVAPGTLKAAAVNFGEGVGALNFNHTDESGDHEFAPGISGAGAINHLSGFTKLMGDSTNFSGRTTVMGGTLSVDNVFGGDVMVNGGRLEGIGQIGGLNVNRGTFAPGNSIGTMTVNGNLALSGAATFEVEVDAAGNSDRVIVNGTVDLTGTTLTVLAEAGTYADETKYTIIENDGTDAVSGSFGQVSVNSAFLTPSVDYAGGTGNDVVLTLEGVPFTTAVTGGGSSGSIPSGTGTGNQLAVARALDQFPTDNALFGAIFRLTSFAEAREAFNALSGEIHASVAGTLVDDSRYPREAVMGRMMQAGHQGGALGNGGPRSTDQVAQRRAAQYNDGAMRLGEAYDGKSLVEMPAAQPLAFWTQAYGAWGTFDGDGNAATADRNLGGFISGMDARLAGTWRVGLATGASFSDVSVDERYSSANTSTYHLGGYVGGEVSGLALRAGGLWAWSEIETSRAVAFTGFFERQKADYDADTGQLFGEIAYPTQAVGIEVEPFAGLAYVSVETGGFRERGGPDASLRSSGFDQDVGYTTLGLRAAKTMMWGGMAVTPRVEAAWLHAFDDVTPDASLAFATTGIGFDVAGVPLAEDSALLDAGLDLAISDRLSAGVSYQGQYADSVSDNAVKGRLTWLFN